LTSIDFADRSIGEGCQWVINLAWNHEWNGVRNEPWVGKCGMEMAWKAPDIQFSTLSLLFDGVPPAISIFREPEAVLGLNSPRLRLQRRLRSAISVEKLLWAVRRTRPFRLSTDFVWYVWATPLCGKTH